jgi:hypothetical protein
VCIIVGSFGGEESERKEEMKGTQKTLSEGWAVLWSWLFV